MNFADFVLDKSTKSLDKTAIIHKEQEYSYENLNNAVNCFTAKINNLNLTLDEKIVIISDNSFFFIVAYFGIIKSGRVAVPLSPEFGKNNLLYVYSNCDVRFTCVQNKYLDRIKELGIPQDYICIDQPLNSSQTSKEYFYLFDLSVESNASNIIREEDLAVIIFTSGSTGIPKGVMLSHKNLIANTSSIIKYLELMPSDRIMVVLPFSYCFGTSLLHTHLRVGGSVVINNQFMFPGKVLNEINEKKCTNFAGVPSNYQILLRKSPLKKMTFPTLRLVQQAGGKLPNPLIQELRDALPTTRIFIMYGQTEATARISYLPPELLDKKLGSIGKGIPGTFIEVINKENMNVKPGEIGEIVASGDNVMVGYWKDPQGTASVIRNGKLYTGDLGIIDNDGFVFLTDREKDIIKCGGYRVSPKEIEDYLAELKDIVEVGVIGIPDEILGEAIKAFIVISENSTVSTQGLILYCQKHFPPFKVPREIQIIKTLPKNTSGKVDKPALRKISKL